MKKFKKLITALLFCGAIAFSFTACGGGGGGGGNGSSSEDGSSSESDSSSESSSGVPSSLLPDGYSSGHLNLSSYSNLTFNIYRGGSATLHSTQNPTAYANGTWVSGSTNSGNVLSGVTLKLSGSNGNVTWTLKDLTLVFSGTATDSSGEYYSGSVTSGTYTLENSITGSSTASLVGSFKLYLKK